ncbi:MAG TPA: hypothetical protein VGK97_03650 [Spongiibacteraceae bacterium]
MDLRATDIAQKLLRKNFAKEKARERKRFEHRPPMNLALTAARANLQHFA